MLGIGAERDGVPPNSVVVVEEVEVEVEVEDVEVVEVEVDVEVVEVDVDVLVVLVEVDVLVVDVDVLVLVVEVDVLVLVDVEVDVEVDVVLVDVEVEVVESITKVFERSIEDPCESTTFAVRRTIPKALASIGTTKLAEFDVRALDCIREKITFEVRVFVTRKL